MSDTNVPAIQWVDGAPVLPAESDILAGVWADYASAFGAALNQNLTTPAGQLVQSETAIIGDKNSQIAYIANQFNPQTASGQFQDALGAIYFLNRIAAAGTVVDCVGIGAPGTVIPAGSVAQDANGYRYSSTADVTISASGSAQIQFQNQITGAIACQANSLNKIYTTIAGWDTVNNPTAGALGNDVESRAQFEYRRQNSVAANSINSTQSILASVLAVNGVIDAYVVDNDTGAPVNFGVTNYTLAAHSVCVSVAGGAASDIAKAIWNKKSIGCSYNGNTSVVVSDTSYNPPYPQYTVTWLTPTTTPVYFAVTLKNISGLPVDIVAQVQSAIIQAFSGADGGLRARIAQSTYAGRYYAGIASIGNNVEILSVLMGFSAGAANQTGLTFGIDQLPSIEASNISVTLV